MNGHLCARGCVCEGESVCMACLAPHTYGLASKALAALRCPAAGVMSGARWAKIFVIGADEGTRDQRAVGEREFTNKCKTLFLGDTTGSGWCGHYGEDIAAL